MTTQAYLYRHGDLMQLPTVADFETESYTLHMTGTATTLGPEEENETVRLLRETVKEVTGRVMVQSERGPLHVGGN